MDFSIPEELRMLRDSARRFVGEELMPLEAQYADHPDIPTPRRKPGTGMIEEAIRDHQIDPKRSWFIGDKDIDIASGRAAGCRTILVLTGYGEKHRNCGADFVVPDVTAAISTILADDS